MVLPQLASAYALATLFLVGYLILLRRLGNDGYAAGGITAIFSTAKIFFAAIFMGAVAIPFLILSPQVVEGSLEPVLQSMVERVRSMQQLTGSLASAIFLQNAVVAVLAALVPLGLGSLDSYLRKNRIYSVFTRILATPVDLVYRLTSRTARIMSPDERLTSLAVITYPFIIMFVNGVLLGIVFLLGILGGRSLQLLVLILPHGVVELPTVIFSASLGYSYVAGWMSRKSEDLRFTGYASRLIRSKGLWLTVVFIVAELSVAAYIEGEVTVQLAALGRSN